MVLVISSLNPYGLHPVSARTYLLMLLNIGSFVLGFAVMRVKFNSDLIKKGVPSGVNEFLQSKKLKILLIICVSSTLYIYYLQSSVVVLYNLGYLRDNFYELMFEGKSWLAFLYVCILSPMFDILLIVFFYLVIYCRRWKYIYSMLAFIIPFVFLAGGRTRAMMLSVYFLFACISNCLLNEFPETKKKLVFGRRQILLVSIMIIGLFSVFVYTSSLRLGNTEASKDAMKMGLEKSLTQMCTYSVGPIRAFDYALDHNYLEKIGGYKYGRATIGGLESFIERTLRHGAMIDFQSVTKETVQYLQENDIVIGKGNENSFNFAYTNAIYHYFDFGASGILVFPFIFGFLFHYYVKILSYYKTFPAFLLVGLFFEISIYSVFSLRTATDPGLIPLFVLLMLWIKKDIRKRVILSRPSKL